MSLRCIQCDRRPARVLAAYPFIKAFCTQRCAAEFALIEIDSGVDAACDKCDGWPDRGTCTCAPYTRLDWEVVGA